MKFENDNRVNKFVENVKAESVKWLADHINDDTRAALIITDSGARQYWAFSPHIYDATALADLLNSLDMAREEIASRLDNALDRMSIFRKKVKMTTRRSEKSRPVVAKGWPKDGSPTNPEQLTKSLRDAIEAAYDLKLKSTKSIQWRGPGLGAKDLVICVDVEEALSEKGLATYRQHGCDTLDVLLLIAIRLGIEQGRRIQKTEQKTNLETAANLIGLVLK